MTITKWMTGQLARGDIEKVEVARETEHSVYLTNGRRESKVTDYRVYHHSWEDAHKHLMAAAESKLTIARRSLQLAQSHAGNIKGLKKPEGA